MVDVREDVKKVSDKVVSLEEAQEKVNEVAPQPKPLTPDRTEYELKEIARLPDCVKELQVFEGEAGGYDPWMDRAEAILKDYEISKERPLYRSIVVSIRQQIRGDDPSVIQRGRRRLARDKTRPNAPLRRKARSSHTKILMGQMTQGAKTMDAFYSGINAQFALIIRCLKNGN